MLGFRHSGTSPGHFLIRYRERHRQTPQLYKSVMEIDNHVRALLMGYATPDFCAYLFF